MKINHLLLGSSSRFRQSLLQSTGISFEVRTSPVDEKTILANDPRQLALARAEAKGGAVAQANPGCLVIGADQVLGFHGKSYDKAVDRTEARLRLQEFSGQTHFLHSAFSLSFRSENWNAPQFLYGEVVDVGMTMRSLTAAEIEAYLDTDEWQGVVGCYQFENRGVNLFDRVSGDSSAIIGLPLPQLLAALRSLGVNALVAPQPPWTLLK